MRHEFPASSLKSFIDVSDLGEQELLRKQYVMSNIHLDEQDEHTVIADVSVESIDADGDLVISKGVDLSRFIKSPNVYVNHNYSELPVASATNIEVLDKSIRMKYKIADTLICNEVWGRLKSGVKLGNSIGFIIKSALVRGTKEFKNYVEEKMLQIDDSCKRIITSYLLVENSICGLPCNADASNIAISTKTLKTPEDIKPEVITKVEEVKVEEVKVEAKVEEAKVIVEADKLPINTPIVEVKEVIVEVEPIVEPCKPITKYLNIIRVGNYDIDKIKKNYEATGIICK